MQLQGVHVMTAHEIHLQSEEEKKRLRKGQLAEFLSVVAVVIAVVSMLVGHWEQTVLALMLAGLAEVEMFRVEYRD